MTDDCTPTPDGRLAEELHRAGLGHWREGRYDLALPLFERGVAIALAGGVAGRERATRCLYEIGMGHLRAGRHDEAQPWFARAAEALPEAEAREAPAGTLRCRALHLAGACHLHKRPHEEALPWLARAAEALQQAGAPVDHDALGQSLYLAGVCHARAGRLDEALQWFERATEAAQRGDAQGRVHPENVLRARNALVETHRRLDG